MRAMRPGSVIVDLAAEAGGNCEATVPGTLSVYDGVKVIGTWIIAIDCSQEPKLLISI